MRPPRRRYSSVSMVKYSSVCCATACIQAVQALQNGYSDPDAYPVDPRG